MAQLIEPDGTEGVIVTIQSAIEFCASNAGWSWRQIDYKHLSKPLFFQFWSHGPVPLNGGSDLRGKISFFSPTLPLTFGPLQAAGFYLKVTNNDTNPRPDCHPNSTLTRDSNTVTTTPTNLDQSRSQIINNTLESSLTFTFSDAAGNTSATVLEHWVEALPKPRASTRTGI